MKITDALQGAWMSTLWDTLAPMMFGEGNYVEGAIGFVMFILAIVLGVSLGVKVAKRFFV